MNLADSNAPKVTAEQAEAINWPNNYHGVRSVSIWVGSTRAYVSVSEFTPISGYLGYLFNFRIVAIVPDTRSFKQSVEYIRTNNYNDPIIDATARSLARLIAQAEQPSSRAAARIARLAKG